MIARVFGQCLIDQHGHAHASRFRKRFDPLFPLEGAAHAQDQRLPLPPHGAVCLPRSAPFRRNLDTRLDTIGTSV